jgi:hypothetical protein
MMSPLTLVLHEVDNSQIQMLQSGDTLQICKECLKHQEEVPPNTKDEIRSVSK